MVYNNFMTRVSHVDLAPLSFSPTQEQQPFRSQTGKIGWFKAMSPKPGVSFDLTIKDGLGRVRMQRVGCKTDTVEYGEAINMPTNFGEDLQVEVSNLKGTDKLTVLLN